MEKGNADFKRYVEKKVRDTIRKYELFDRDSKIAVAVSGGKDSTVCLYLLKKLGYNVEAVTIDVAIGNYTKENLKNIKEVCKTYDVPLNIIAFREVFGMSLCYIQSILKSKGHTYASCMLCGILKRYLLNKFARENNFDILTTGHNLDDEAQAFLMNVFRNDLKLVRRQGPISGSSHSDKFVRRVKPLFFLKEEEVERFSKLMDFPIFYGMCPCSVGSYRRKHKELLDNYEKEHPSVKYNVLRFQEQMKNRLVKEEGEISTCKSCGEPSNNDICKVCKILQELKSAPKEKF